MVAGVVLYLILIALSGDVDVVRSGEEIPRAMLLVGLLAAMAAHFVEINFGIAIAATRTYFWTFAALLLTIGYTFPKVGASLISSRADEEAAVDRRERSSTNIQKKKRKTVKTPLRPGRESRPSWLQDGIAGGLLIAILLVTLGYNFVNTGQADGSAIGTVWGSFTRLGAGSSAASFGVLVMVFLSWLAGAVIFASESEFSGDQITWLNLIGSMLGISLAAGLVYWLWHSAALLTILGSTPGTMEEVLVKVAQYESLAARFYAGLFLLVLALAVSLAYEEQRKLRPASLYGSALAPVLIVIALGLSAFSNLRVVQADIAFKLADPFTRSGSWPMAIAVYNRAIQLAPSEDFYYLFLGRAYLEQARTLESAADRDQLIEQAEKDLRRAQVINPLNTDHTANLARLFSQWASFTTDTGARTERGVISDQYFQRAVVLSPNNARLRDEWALLYFNVFQQPDQALQRLDHSLGLDPFYDWTHAIFAEVYAQKAKDSTDATEKVQAEEDAVASYQEAIRRAGDLQTKLTYMVSLAQFHIDLQQPQQAIPILEQAVQAAPQASDLWRYEQTLAQLYIQTGEKQRALEHANRALAAAPPDQQTQMQEFITQLETIP
jgi:tetratricopeptide (TPR) repeat protein